VKPTGVDPLVLKVTVMVQGPVPLIEVPSKVTADAEFVVVTFT
jgi:hypothetical protein